jgi:hypothetical protein
MNRDPRVFDIVVTSILIFDASQPTKPRNYRSNPSQILSFIRVLSMGNRKKFHLPLHFLSCQLVDAFSSQLQHLVQMAEKIESQPN